MARQPKPWFRADRKVWCVTIDGVRHNLGQNKKEAYARFRELLRMPRQSREIVTSTSLVKIVDEFLDWVHRNRSAATYEWYRYRLQDFIVSHQDFCVEQIQPYHVEKWAGKPGYSVTSKRNQMRSVKRCFKWALSHGYLSKNPIEYLEIPSGQSRDTYVSKDEFARVLTYLSDSNFIDLLKVTYETGCRPQELLRVEARHVDTKHARWVFPANEAKVKSMPRVVYLTDYAAQVTLRLASRWPTGTLFRNSNDLPWDKASVGCAFDRLKIRMGKELLKEQGETIDPKTITEYMLTLNPIRTSQGKPIRKTEAELRCEAKRKLTQRRARQIAPRYSLYAFRHSWATNALQSGVDALTVAILMGHKDPSTLARTYQHLSHNPEHMLAQAQKAVG